MSYIFWNIRGLGLEGQKKIIVEVIRNNRLQIICLIETKLKKLPKKQERELQGV